MPDRITSLSNPKIKRVVRLREAKERKRSSLTIIEGERETLQALKTGVEIEACFISEGHTGNKVQTIIEKLKEQKKPVTEVSDAVYTKIGYGDKKEGLLCLAKTPTLTLKDLQAKAEGLYVVVEHVEKPGNLGAILRICDAVEVEAVLFCEQATDIYNPNTIRSSLGAVFTVTIVGCSNDEALSFFKKNNITTVATSPDAKKLYYEEPLPKGIAFILGSEMAGLSPFWLEQADREVRIPMNGSVDSLNVSASTAIILYEYLRQRSQ